MYRTTLPLGILPALLLASCASQPERIRFLEGLPMAYQGRIAMAAQAESSSSRLETIPASALKMDGPAMEVEARLYAVDRDILTRLLGLPRWRPTAGIVDLEKARAALESLRIAGLAETISTPRMVSWSDQEVRISQAEKFSYIRSFLLKQDKKAIVADPQVGTLRFSTELLVKASPWKDKKGVDLQVEIHLANPPGVLPVVHVQSGIVPRGFSLQAPLLFFQDISTRARLTPDRGALITGFDSKRSGRGLVALLWTRVYPASPKGEGTSGGAGKK